jgi:predicted Zn finger-like uncharacterized protein
MLIVCPSCATAYDVESASLQPDGRRVRCVRCRTVWRAEPSQADKLLAAAAALAPQHGPLEVPVTAAAEPEFAAAGIAETFAEAQWDHLSSDAAPAQAGADRLDGSGAHFPTGIGDAAEVEAPPIVPVDLDDGRPPIDIDGDHAQQDGQPEDIESVAARRIRQKAKGRQRGAWSLSSVHLVILGLIIVDSILIGWRKDIVHVLPQTASLYAAIGLPVNLRGLVFDDVATSVQTYQGVPILVVQGKIVNVTGGAVDVPRLKLVVRNAARQEVYSWTTVPPQKRLPAHWAAAFRARLASPPPDSRDVLVRFLNPRDFMATAR